MTLEDLFIPREHSDTVKKITESQNTDEYEDILLHPLMSRLERFDDWEQECIDAGYRHMFEMNIGSARDWAYTEASEDTISHYYIQKFIDAADLLKSPHSTIFIGASYGFPNNGIRVRLNPNKNYFSHYYALREIDGIVPECYSMHMCVCIRFGKYVTEWFRMMQRLWNTYRNEYNNQYCIGIWDHHVWIYSGNNVAKQQRKFQKCETHSMHNFGENMCHIADVMEHDKQFSPSLCECMTKGCQKYMIFDLTPLEVAKKIRHFFDRYATGYDEDPYNRKYNHTCFYY